MCVDMASNVESDEARQERKPMKKEKEGFVNVSHTVPYRSHIYVASYIG